MVEPRRVVGHDAADIAHRRVGAGRLGDGEGRIAAEHLRRARGHGHAPDAEALEQLVAGPVVVEQHDAPPRVHESVHLVDIERALGVNDEERVTPPEYAHVQLRGDHDALRPELGLGDRDQLRQALPVLPPGIQGRRACVAWHDERERGEDEKKQAPQVCQGGFP